MADMYEFMCLADIQPNSAHALRSALTFGAKPKKTKKFKKSEFDVFIKMCAMWATENMLLF